MLDVLLTLALLLGSDLDTVRPGKAAGGEAASYQQAPQAPLPEPRKAKKKGPRVATKVPACVPAGCPDKAQTLLAGANRGVLFGSEEGAKTSVEGLIPPRDQQKDTGPAAAAGRRGRDRASAWLAERKRAFSRLRQVLGAGADERVLLEAVLDPLKTARIEPGLLSSGPVIDAQDLSRFPVRGVWSRTLQVRKDDVIELNVSELKVLKGYLSADPVAWALEIREAGDPERSVLLSRSDDHEGTVVPALRLVAARNMNLRLLVAAQRISAAALGRVTVTQNGRTRFDDADAILAGGRVSGFGLETGDRILATAGAPGQPVQGGDPVLVLFADERIPGAEVLISNNAMGLYAELEPAAGFLPAAMARGGVRLSCGLERIETWSEEREAACATNPALCPFCGAVAENASLLLASFDGGPLDAPLLLHLSQEGDEDGDGLDARVERILGTCDAEKGCKLPFKVKGLAWDPFDCDMDGLSDLEELWGVRRCFSAPPQPPQNNPGQCIDLDGNGRCDSRCGEGTWEVEQVLGPVMEASPLVYDVYVEQDVWSIPSPNGERKVLFPEQRYLAELQRFYSVPAGKIPMRVHWYNDDAVPIESVTAEPKLPSAAHRHAWFNALFTAERKLAGVFRYAFGVKGGGAQSDVSGRAAIIGMDPGGKLSARVAHELGHLLGLSHNNDRAAPDRSPFYTSIMNYGFVYSLPPRIDWDGQLKACGGGPRACESGFVCTLVNERKLCLPACGDFRAFRDTGGIAFSDGQPETPAEFSEEQAIPELQWAREYLPWYYCYIDEGKNKDAAYRVARFQARGCRKGACVKCFGSTCGIDFNKDGSFQDLEGFDLDHNGAVDSIRLANKDDLTRIYSRGTSGLRPNGYEDVVLFSSGFEGGSVENLLPLAMTVKDGSAGLWDDTTNYCDEKDKWSKCRKRSGGKAVMFRGPASGDGPLEYSFCGEEDADCRAAFTGERGFTLSLRLKVMAPGWDDAAVVVASVAGYTVSVRVEPDTENLIWGITDPGKGKTRLRQVSALGLWQRLTLQQNPKTRQWSFAVRYLDRQYQTSGKAPARKSDLSRFQIGGREGKKSQLTGFIDDVILIQGCPKGF